MLWKSWDSSEPGADQQFSDAVSEDFKANDGDSFIFDLPAEDTTPTEVPPKLHVGSLVGAWSGSWGEGGLSPEWKAFTQRLKASGKKFVDPGFKLVHDSQDPSVSWRRPNQCELNSVLFPEDGPRADNVVQGALGDCWFISAMVICATCPGDCKKGENTVVNLFEGSDLDIGLVVVRFYKYGKPIYVMVDDRLPVANGKTPIYGRNANSNVWWVALWEKAYAKLMGGYRNLDGGSIEYGLSDISGAPPSITKYDQLNHEELRSSTGLAAGLYNELGEDFTSTHTEDEILREMVLKFEQTRQFLGAKDLVGMAAISLGDDGRGTESDLGNGILGGHAYAFQSLHDLGNRVLVRSNS